MHTSASAQELERIRVSRRSRSSYSSWPDLLNGVSIARRAPKVSTAVVVSRCTYSKTVLRRCHRSNWVPRSNLHAITDLSIERKSRGCRTHAIPISPAPRYPWLRRGLVLRGGNGPACSQSGRLHGGPSHSARFAQGFHRCLFSRHHQMPNTRKGPPLYWSEINASSFLH